MTSKPLKTFTSTTIRNRLNVIIFSIIVILLIVLVNFWISMKIMSSIRAYVNGEGLWSKYQKEAVINLAQYANTNNLTYYTNFNKDVAIPLGDRQARLELNKAMPNQGIVRDGFIKGGNNPSDVNDLTFLYTRFRNYKYLAKAIDYWKQGDQQMGVLISTGKMINNLEQNNPTDSTQLSKLVQKIYVSDNNLTNIENNFSSTLGEGSRVITQMLSRLFIIIILVLGLLTLLIAVLVSRTLIRLDKAKSEFVSLASHQLRTPITAINWYAESLLSKKSSYSPQQKRLIGELYASAQKSSRMIADLLSVSMIDLGTYKPELKYINTEQVINTTLKELKPITKERKIKVGLAISPKLKIIYSDERVFSAVMQNLITNSVKYSEDGGTINIDLKIYKKALLIKVKDSGIGIPAKQQKEIFNKLFRAENAKKIDGNHSGLGLYIAKGMVDKLKGDIWLESKEKKGTTFYVKLPIYNEID